MSEWPPIDPPRVGITAEAAALRDTLRGGAVFHMIVEDRERAERERVWMLGVAKRAGIIVSTHVWRPGRRDYCWAVAAMPTTDSIASARRVIEAEVAFRLGD